MASRYSLLGRLAGGITAFRRAFSSVPLPPYKDIQQLLRQFSLSPEDNEYADAYRLVPAVSFAVSLMQDAISAIPLRFYRTTPGGERVEVERTPGPTFLGVGMREISDLWATANVEDTGYDLKQQLVGSFFNFGAAYLFKDYLDAAGIKRGLPQQLWMLDPARVVPVISDRRIITEYRVSTGSLGQYIPVPAQQIVMFRRYDPNHNLNGLSVLESLRLTYGTQRDAERTLRAFFARGGVMPGYFSTETAMGEDEIKFIKAQFKGRHASPEKAGDPIILPKKLKYERAGLTMAEMLLPELDEMSLMKVLRALKIPPVMAGIKTGGGLSDAGATTDALMFIQNAMQPPCRSIEATINEKLLAAGEFGAGVVCEFDFSGLLPLQEVFLNQAKTYESLAGGPVLTPNEARERMGYDPLPGGDELRERQSQIPADMVAPPRGRRRGRSSARVIEEGRELSRDQLRTRENRRLARHERAVRRGWLRVLDSQRGRVKERLRDQLRLVRVVDVNKLLTDEEVDRRKVKALLRAVARGAGEAALAELGLDLAFDLNAVEVATFIETKALASLTNVNSTTREALRESLSEGVRENESLGELVARVDEVFDGRRDNALTIARTETAGAYNFATTEAWSQSGVVESKEWVTAGDELVREAHREADGQVVGLDQPFDVDGESLDYPGDPGGSPGNIINCRCTVVAVLAPLDDERGLKQLLDRKRGLALPVPHKNGKVKPDGRSLEEFFAGR